MGYLFRALPPDLLTAEPPQLSPIEPDSDRERRLTTVFLSTVLAVPEFRTRILQLVGARGFGGKAEVFCEVRFRGESDDPDNTNSLPDGLIRTKGPGGFAALLESKRQAFNADNSGHVRQMAKHLTIARERKVQRVIALANVVPDQAFVQALGGHSINPPVDRLRGLTWMETVDVALHLLDRKVVRGPVGVFLLEQYVRFVKEEAVRDAQSRFERPEGAIYFTSLGKDWESIVGDVRNGSLDSRDPRLATVATNWLSFLRFLSLYLTRGSQREEDILVFPNVRGLNLTARKDVVIRRLSADGNLLATFKKHSEEVATVLAVDLRNGRITMQIEVDGPPDRGPTLDRIRDLAESVRNDRTSGTTIFKVFWPGEKAPRVVTRDQALKDPIATAPPQHGMVPERFIVERNVPCEAVAAEPETFVQLLILEMRGFRASVRHVLRRGLPGG